MKISIITVVFNGEKTIRDTIESILNQTYKDIEYIIIDGNSNDGTMNIVNEFKDNISTIISEKDEGLYDAINKGISLATGDVIGLLHSDDFYTDNFAIQRVVDAFQREERDTVFADLIYIKNNDFNKVLRYYSAKKFSREKLKYGLMPPHPTFFVKKEIYEKYGLYKTNYKIAADYEMFFRLFARYNVSYSYIHFPIVKMRTGGLSSGGILNKILINKEVLIAMKENGHNSNHIVILKKYPSKIVEIVKGYVYNFLIRAKRNKK